MRPNNTFILLLILLCGAAHGERALGARHAAPSPDGSRIAFSYHGDIWTADAAGGRAERLTVNPAYDSRPYWSPDGKTIAFMTDRWGNDDICVMPADGSAPARRLTFHGHYDLPLGWSLSGEAVIFLSHRHTLRPVLYQAPVQGGTPRVFLNFEAYNPAFLPDGKTVYYDRGGEAWWRRRYRGGANQEIWKKTLPDGPSERVSRNESRDAYPMYSRLDGKIYFTSDRGSDMVNNLWRMDLDGGNPEQLTFEKEDIHFPRMSFDGSLISYECFNEICAYDVRARKTDRPVILASEDHTVEPFSIETFTGNATEFRLSPAEDELAFVVHGDIFVMELKESAPGKVVQVTNTAYVEKDVAWHPTEEMLICTAMEDGDHDIHTVVPRKEKKFYDDLVFTPRKILDTDNTEYKPAFSPDGKAIAYLKNHGELYTMTADGKQSVKICPENDVLWIDWSPDSRWVAFSRTVLGWREDVFVVRADGKPGCVNISNHPNDDYMPMWSRDGTRIAFASRDAIGNLWIKYVFLTEEDEQRDQEYWEKAESETTTVATNVRIDFERMSERIHTVTQVSGYYNRVAQSPDGRRFAVHSDNFGGDDIWTVDWLGKELKRVTQSSVDPKMFSVSRDRKKIHYLSRTGQFFLADIATAQSQPLAFRLRIPIDRQNEREQVFKQAWWALQDGFYDSDFHGVDWKAMRDKYRDWALFARETRDFHDVIRMMMGELNASHLGVWKSGNDAEKNGAIGIIADPSYAGEGIRVMEVIPNTPAHRSGSKISPQDVITHINGRTIGERTDIDEVLRDMSGKEVALTVRSGLKTRDIRITAEDPGSILSTVDKNWVQANKDHVHEQTGDRIGYVYIASMGESNLKKFEKDLYEEMDREGLVIDIRYNGGGSIHDELLDILRRTAYAYSMERGGQRSYSSLFKWDKPTVLLINEFCYSDAEIFPAGFKELGFGTVVGMPTFGAVIGTNDIELHDGTYFRVPGTGWYLLNGVNLENTPVEPDIRVENAPEQDGSSQDNQLERAIELLL